MKKVTLLLAAMLILQSQISAQVTESYITNNLGRIVEVATPSGALSQPRVLIGWDENGFVKQENSTSQYKVFGNTPHTTVLNDNGFNIQGRFGAPSGHDAIEIRFGDSSRYWIGNNLAPDRVPFGIYNVGPKAGYNPAITGGVKLCLQVFDENANGLFDPGERVNIYGDLALPIDSAYEHLSGLSTFPLLTHNWLLSGIRIGIPTIPYTNTIFTPATDGFLPPAGTVIRFIPQSTDTTKPFFTVDNIEQDTGTFLYSNLIRYYSFEKPAFELIQAPPRMIIDTNGTVTWKVYSHQMGNRYEAILKLNNSSGSTIKLFVASVHALTPADTGIVQYTTTSDGNRIRFWQANQGSIGYRITSSDFGMEYPKGTGYSLNYAGGLYLGVKKPGTGSDPDTISVSNHEFSGEFQPGRILNSGPFSGLIADNYHTNQTFFALSENTHNWPAGAPKNIYGLPIQFSGKDTWTVFNDLDLSKHSRDNNDSNLHAPGLGVEVQRQTFQFGHYPFYNAVLVRYTVINKTNRPYKDAYIGFWDDVDLGAQYSDDMCQADSALSLVITYNSPAGNDPAKTAQGKLILQGPMVAGQATDTASIIRISSSGLANVKIPGKKSFFSTSALSPLKMQHPSSISGDQTRYFTISGYDAFGNPKPNGPFDLLSGSLYPGDQRTLLSTGPFNFAPGDTQEVWMAYIGGQGVDNASAVDTVRHYAEWILNDFKNNQIYKFDQTAPSLSIYGLSTQAVNRVRFVVNANEPLVSAFLSASGAALTLQPAKNGYYTDYDIRQTGNISLTMTGKDLAGNIGSLNKTYQVSSLNKPAAFGKYTFHPDGEGYLLTSKTDAKNIPEKCFLIGEPVEWITTQNNGQMNIEYAFTNSDLIKVQNRYDKFDVMNLGLYSWNGEKWEAVETAVSSNKLSGMAKGSVMAVFYNPEGNHAPQRFALEANYPNPFNPSTVIRYQLAGNSKVSLKIYNLLGQEVRTLVNTQKSSGIHTAVWDGKNNQGQRVSSGVYLYRLEAGDFVKTRKMVLVK